MVQGTLRLFFGHQNPTGVVRRGLSEAPVWAVGGISLQAPLRSAGGRDQSNPTRVRC